jgi:Flp pilus assembly protein TadB
VIDDSTCRLDYELHTRNPDVPDEAGSVQIADGGIVLFDGDKLRHRVTPARPERDARVADVRIRDRSRHAAVEALHLEHEGRDRLFRLPPGVQAAGDATRDRVMTRAGLILLSVGTALFVALLAWQGVGAVASTFLAAGWGLALVAAFHVVPLVIDARRSRRCSAAASPAPRSATRCARAGSASR